MRNWLFSVYFHMGFQGKVKTCVSRFPGKFNLKTRRELWPNLPLGTFGLTRLTSCVSEKVLFSVFFSCLAAGFPWIFFNPSGWPLRQYFG